MKANKIWGALLAATFGLAAMSAATDAEAQKKKKADAVVLTSAAQAIKPIQILPATAPLKWGLTAKETAKAIDTMLEAEYKPKYQATSPGIKMKQLDAQLAEEKNAFRRSRIEFGALPVALDSTPLKGEYSYNNKEAILTLSRKGETRYFFFIQDRLWKIIDEVPLSEKSRYGKNFQEAAVKLTALYGAVGRVIAANPDKQVYATTVDWKDSTTHVRLVERHEAAAAIVLEELATANNIDTLRANKPVVEDEIDPAVRAIARGSEPPAGPPVAPTQEKKQKK